MNIAQRMELHDRSGRIQASAAFRTLAGDAFAYEACGEIEIKGAAPVETWWLGVPLIAIGG